jgi:RimJ/RimL family protein N-acetyltransferase
MAKVFTKLQILTPRLLLRPLEMQDFEAWAMFMADPEATRFLGGAQPRALAWRGFMTVAGAWHMQGFSMFSVVERATQRWVGRLGPWMPEGWPGTEVGWGIIRDCEGATAAIDWAFDELGWNEVIHAIDARNAASQAVARKLGSTLSGVGLLPEPIATSVEIWGQSRAAWHARDTVRNAVKHA